MISTDSLTQAIFITVWALQISVGVWVSQIIGIPMIMTWVYISFRVKDGLRPSLVIRSAYWRIINLASKIQNQIFLDICDLNRFLIGLLIHQAVKLLLQLFPSWVVFQQETSLVPSVHISNGLTFRCLVSVQSIAVYVKRLSTCSMVIALCMILWIHKGTCRLSHL